MNENQLMEFIKEHADPLDFTGGVDKNKIEFIESELKVNLPESYKNFLRRYGMGGIFGVEILGYGKSSTASVVIQTKRYRKLGLPLEYVVIENCDEFAYCLATNKMIDKECPVISWDRIDGFGGERGSTFVSFLADRLLDAKDNWE